MNDETRLLNKVGTVLCNGLALSGILKWKSGILFEADGMCF